MSIKVPKKGSAPSRTYDLSALRRALTEKARGSDLFEFKQGSTKCAILQPRGMDVHFVERRAFYIPSVTPGGRKQYFTSPKSIDMNAYCPGYAVYAKLKNSTSETSKALASEMRPEECYISYAMVLIGDKWELRAIKYKWSVFEAVGKLICDEMEENDDDATKLTIVHPRKPRILTIERTGTGQNDTRYSARATGKTLPEPIDSALLKSKPALDSYVGEVNKDAMEEALCAYLGVDELSDFLSADGKVGKKKKGKVEERTKKKRKPAPVEEDDDDEDDGEDEELEEDEDEDEDDDVDPFDEDDDD